MHFFKGAQRRIESNPHSQRVIHGGAAVSALLAARQIEVGNFGDKVILRPMGRLKFREILSRDQGSFSHIGSDHGHHPAGIEHDLCRLRVVIDICFRRAVDIPASDRAAHDDDIPDQSRNRWILRNRKRDVGQWSHRN